MQNARLFLAIDLNDETLYKLSSTMVKLKKYFPNAKWCVNDNIHLTLKFFGTIPLASVYEIGKAVKSVISNKSPIQFVTQGIGGFPNLDNPRVIWAGISKGKEEIINLANNLSRALEDYNFIPEKRKFIPHITLARFNRRAKPKALDLKLPENILNSTFGTTETDEVLLYSSELTKKGPIYSVIDRWEFGK